MSYDLADFAGDVVKYVQEFKIVPEHIRPFLVEIGPFISPFIALLGLVFTIYAWWSSRERNMFNHMKRVLNADDRKLLEAERRIVSIIKEPGPAIDVEAPSFSDWALTRLLDGGIWRKVLSFKSATSQTERSLDVAIDRIRDFETKTRERQTTFDQQMATALLIKGNLAAHRALAPTLLEHERSRWNEVAKELFDEVLRINGHGFNRLALEGLGEQHLRLQSFSDASGVFQKLIDQSVDGKQTALAKWHKADAMVKGNMASRVGRMQDASALMSEAIEGIGLPAANDLRALYRFARMHDTHCKIRMLISNPGGVSKISFERAIEYYSKVDSVINDSRNNIWKNIVFLWAGYWRGDRTDELLRRAQMDSAGLSELYGEYARKVGPVNPIAPINQPSTSGIDVEPLMLPAP